MTWKDRVVRHNLFLCVGAYKTRGHKFKIRVERFKGDQRVKPFHTEGGGYVEQAGKRGGGGKYNVNV